MAPKVARTQSPCEIGEGISTMRRLLNGLHRPRAGLHTELFNLCLTTALLFWNSGTNTFGFRMRPITFMALRSNQVALIISVDSTCKYKAIFPYIDIHKPRLPHSFCFLDHFIIIVACFRINYHDHVGFRINVKDFGRTYGRRLCYRGKDYRGVF
ncbi:DNA-directed RNA polymerases II, IV and V subunit 3-like [Pyrus ussuriensis x Pyrus communis]|uniref:DNA-directed RNA polymerases II, IV and V subunit 3-like n=1 Tax=Pyrus ussuriensis x Pyrus communis TaxID=2448454 RepID=A0A5N5H391_9ROSA|nr:DNA-directed RNA polymerases II, IV and V subunit 3-like [Pyrus ussuriensis x Pyrus communis]